jgi:hypothetical protein
VFISEESDKKTPNTIERERETLLSTHPEIQNKNKK